MWGTRRRDLVIAAKVCFEDSKVVPRGVGELWAPGDVTGCPDMISRGMRVIIHLDEPAAPHFYASRLQSKIGDHWRTPRG